MNITELLQKCHTLNELSREIFGKANYTNREKIKKILFENNIDWKEWLLNKKEEKVKYCIVCGKKLEKEQVKFCGHSCSAKYTNSARKKVLYCKNCNKELKSSQKYFCSNKCQSDYEYKVYIEKWKHGEENGLSGDYSISRHIKRFLLEKNNCACEICGCNWINPKSGKPIVEIHHIDGNYLNNKEDNLQVLCPNHHAMTDNFKNNNEIGRKKRKKDVQST